MPFFSRSEASLPAGFRFLLYKISLQPPFIMEGVDMKTEKTRNVGFILLTSIMTIVILVIVGEFLIGINFEAKKEGNDKIENPSENIESKEEEEKRTLYYLDF